MANEDESEQSAGPRTSTRPPSYRARTTTTSGPRASHPPSNSWGLGYRRLHELWSAVPGLGAGLVAGLLVVAVGLFLAAAEPTTWTAQSQMLLAPSLQGGATATSSYYATLTGGQLPATAAAIVQENRFLTDTRRALELSDRDSVTARVTVVPETAILNIEVTASSSRTAVDVADELPARAAPTVNRLLEPYFVTVLGSAHGTATQSSLGTGQWVALVALAALVAAIAVQQLVQRRARARVRTEEAAGA